MVKDEKVISALLSSPTIKTASEKCGLSESAIYARLKKPVFRKKYDEAREALLRESRDALLRRTSSAVETLGFLSDFAKSEQVRLNASESIIRTVLKLNEQLDVLQRIKALEDLYSNED